MKVIYDGVIKDIPLKCLFVNMYICMHHNYLNAHNIEFWKRHKIGCGFRDFIAHIKVEPTLNLVLNYNCKVRNDIFMFVR